MRFRKVNIILGFSLLLGLFLLTFMVLDPSPSGLYWDDQAKKLELKHLENKLRDLERDLSLNQDVINEIKGSVKEILLNQGDKIRKSGSSGSNDAVETKNYSVNKTLATIDKKDASFSLTKPSSCDISMGEVYDMLEFDNPDGGVWKQGWEVKYDRTQWNSKKKLKVFVIPHSHNDPGWIKTFEKYYEDQTRHILDSMVTKLSQYKDMKFIWAEISYLSMWWAGQTVSTRQAVLSFLEEGRLEVVTGGYVMPDEANSHYTSLLEQLMYGHEWCNLNLNGYKPNSGWSIDPFGMSPTSAYILKRAGFDNMLIQRTHYSVKKHLARKQGLEFKWRQHWDHGDTSDILCHMMPFYSYDVPHTCGPDPKVCCQFDFLRLPGGRVTCPWRVSPKAVKNDNVRERAELLLDQYRKKSQLYKTDVLLVPLGDDFRWDSEKEWDQQYQNYKRIMDHVNSSPDLDAEIHWGTLSDYFNELRKSSAASSGDEIGIFPSLSGDFFTYADRDDHYWSGYFTSRPFWKNLDRVLEGYLRAGEIIFSVAWAEMEYIGADKVEMANMCMEGLVMGRKALSLFQHHDGITGTAKDHVVIDYGNKMLSSIEALQNVISQSAYFLLNKSKARVTPNIKTQYFDLDDSRSSPYMIPKQTVIDADTPTRLVIYNSHARRRQELVTIRVSKSDIKIYKITMEEDIEEEETQPSQISPVFKSDDEISNTEFEVTFLVTVPAMGLQTYFIRELKAEDGTNEEMSVARVKLLNSKSQPFQVAPFDSVEMNPSAESFRISNVHLTAEFDSSGLLQSITTLSDKVKTGAKLEFWEYGTTRKADKSGAYLFMPDGPGKRRQLSRQTVKVVEGKLRSCVTLTDSWIRHVLCLHNSPGVDGTGLHIENDIDLTSQTMNNREIAMKISSDIQSGDLFYTDLNGFQMIRRKRYGKLPLQANFYPVASMAYIQDKSSRLSLISGQPLGGTSAGSGQLEIMLDRRLMQDDNRGLFQGVQDNKVTPHHFVLLLERQIPRTTVEADSAASYPSLLGHGVRHSLLNPLFRLIFSLEHYEGHALKDTFSPVEKDLPCDIHVINLRTSLSSPVKMTPSDQSALVLHRQGFTAAYRPLGMTCATNGGKISLDEIFPELFSTNVKQMSLSLMYDGMKMEKSFTVSIHPMEMYSFLLSR